MLRKCASDDQASRKRKREEIEREQPEETGYLPLYPDAMLSVVSKLGANDSLNVSLANRQFASIFNHNSAWKCRFEKHFPHRKAIRIDHADNLYLSNYKAAEQEEYAGITPRMKAIFYAIKERDFAAIQSLNITFHELFQTDAMQKSAFQWIFMTGNQRTLDYIYHVICQHYVDQNPEHIIEREFVDEYGYNRLHCAVLCSQSLDHLQHLIRNEDYDVNQTTTNGHTPLMLATITGKAPLVKFLISMGADVNRADAEGNTALHFASNVDITNSLIAANADINHANLEKLQTPLWIAASQGEAKIVEALMQRKASSMVNHLDQTPLYIAAKSGHTECVEEILKKDINSINYVNMNDRTALFAAAKRGHTNIVRLLMLAGAKWDTYDTNGDTAILIAAKQGHRGIVRLLTAYGADIDQVFDEEDRMTALMHTLNQSDIDTDVVNILLNNDADPNYQCQKPRRHHYISPSFVAAWNQ